LPPKQVVGSSIRTKYEIRDGKPVILRLPEVNFIDDKAGKPVGIQKHIGRLNRGLDKAATRGWTVVDIMSDWNKVFPFQ
jgi:hypothetical protein